jgi:hypothetical protein
MQVSPAPPWDDIRRAAVGAVGGETTDSDFPFARPNAAELAASPRKVFVYYFPFFLVSMGNEPIAHDHWALHYMQRSGEGGKYYSSGGFTRERPLPVGPWASPYWREIDETVDVLRAQAIGVDGFGVGIQEAGQGPTFSISEGICYAAAQAAPGFKVFAEPDGDVLRNVSAEDMAKTLIQYQTCPASLRMSDGHTLLAPFAPQNEPPDYWREVLDRLRAADSTADFIPVLLDPGRFARSFAPISSGMSYWGFRDPVLMNSLAARNVIQDATRTAPIWMQPVAPQDFRPKDAVFWEARNTEAFRVAWMSAIEGNAHYVHLVTWNDYSEATEIAPSSGTQFLFYDLCAYYIVWFKIGIPPKILRDAIYYSHRNQIFQPDHPPLQGDRPYRRFGDTPLSNDVEMLAMLIRPATLEINIAGHVYQQAVPAGLTTFRVPAEPGRPRFRIIRDGAVAVEKISDWTIESNPDAASALYLGGSSTRAFVAMPKATKQ